MRPLNREGPTSEEVVKMVEGYLKTPIKSDGDFPEVTDDDMDQLYKVFNAILEAKFERDCDNDMVINFVAYSHNKGVMHTIFVPHDMTSDLNLLDALRSQQIALSVAEQISRRAERPVIDKIMRERRQEKMAPVFEFLRAAGSDDALHRVETYISGEENNLFVGVRDEVWSALGLTCAEIKQTQSDNYGARYHDAVEDLLLNAVKRMEEPK